MQDPYGETFFSQKHVLSNNIEIIKTSLDNIIALSEKDSKPQSKKGK